MKYRTFRGNSIRIRPILSCARFCNSQNHRFTIINLMEIRTYRQILRSFTLTYFSFSVSGLPAVSGIILKKKPSDCSNSVVQVINREFSAFQ